MNDENTLPSQKLFGLSLSAAPLVLGLALRNEVRGAEVDGADGRVRARSVVLAQYGPQPFLHSKGILKVSSLGISKVNVTQLLKKMRKMCLVSLVSTLVSILRCCTANSLNLSLGKRWKVTPVVFLDCS